MNWLNRIRGEWMVQPRRFLAVLWVILLAVGWSGVAEAAAPVAGIITVEREGKATEGPDLLSGRHPEVVQPFKATLRLTDPNNLCAMPNPNATWTWSVKSVNFSPAAGLDYDPMPTQNGSLAQKVKALADAKAAGITFEVVATEPFLSRCKAKIPAELLDVPGEWTITVQSIWSCPLSGGGQPVSFSGSEDFSYVFHVWTVQLQVDDGAGRHVHAPVNDYAMFKDEVGEIRKHGGEGRKTDKQGNLLHLDKHEKIFPFQVKLHARVLGAPTQEKDPVVVTLANPDGRLGFPTVDKGDPTVKLPIKGTVWHKAHAVNGQVKSAGVGDAVIEVHKGEVLITKRPMTVFWFEGTVAGEAKGEYKVRGEDPRLPKYRWNQRGDINQDFFVSNFGTGEPVAQSPYTHKNT